MGNHTVAEYLALEEVAEYRSEYFEGEIFAMAGATGEHNLIAKECSRAIDDAAEGSGCQTVLLDMKVRIEGSSAYYYPDIAVVCDKFQYEDEKRQILKNPLIIIEVLSDSTEAQDRGSKFHRYKQISSLREYVLISQKEPQIDVFFKMNDDSWRLDSYAGLDAKMELRSLGIHVKLADIYRRVEFAAQGS